VIVNVGGEELDLNEDNTTVFRFREAKHMDHLFIVRENQTSTVIFCDEKMLRPFIDADFPLQTSRWPRPFDFEAYEKYIDQMASDFRHELEGDDEPT
jgi:hypothetical protein